MLLVSLAVGASALVNDLWALGALRFLTGLSLGMTLPNLTALVAELAPAKIRSGLLTVISLGISLGALGSGLVVPKLLPAFGWQGAFLCSAAVGLAFLVLLFFLLPEAPSFLSRDTANVTTPARAQRPPFWQNYATLLSPEYRQRTIALWLLWISNAFMLYIVSSWLPTLLSKSGWDVTGASHSVAWFQGGGMAGGLVIAALMDRWRPRGALIGAYLVCAGGLVVAGLAGNFSPELEPGVRNDRRRCRRHEHRAQRRDRDAVSLADSFHRYRQRRGRGSPGRDRRSAGGRVAHRAGNVSARRADGAGSGGGDLHPLHRENAAAAATTRDTRTDAEVQSKRVVADRVAFAVPLADADEDVLHQPVMRAGFRFEVGADRR